METLFNQLLKYSYISYEDGPFNQKVYFTGKDGNRYFYYYDKCTKPVYKNNRHFIGLLIPNGFEIINNNPNLEDVLKLQINLVQEQLFNL